MQLTVKGIVLRSIAYGDFDRLITILTEEGKIFFKARGIRSVTSKNAAACGMFVYSEFVLEKRGDKHFLLRATPLYSTVKTGCDITSLSLASYLAELCEDTALDAETGKNALRLLINALFLIAKEDRPTDLIKAVFELRLLAVHGLIPLFGSCAVCSRDFAEEDQVLFFRLLEGDFVCRSCITPEQSGTIKVTKSVINLAKRSISCVESEAYAVKIPEKLLREFSAFSERFLITQFDKKYKTLDFYKEVKKLPQVPTGENHESLSESPSNS